MEKERSPEKEYAIDQLATLQSIPESAKSHIILMFLGLKPASTLSMLYKADSKAYSREDFLRDISILKSALDNLGLKYKISDEDTTEEGLQEVWISIGKNDESLEALTEAQKMKVGKDRDKKIGAALGFPETAIEGYTGNRIMKVNELPPEIEKEFRQAEFIPSKDHWKEELEFVREKNQIARQFAPKLFKE